MESRIIEIATRQFISYGIRSITMDEIAGELGISKKTIYNFFSDKEKLVFKAVESALAHEKSQFELMSKQAENPIHEIFLHMAGMKEILSGMNLTFLYDLEKFYPEAHKLYIDFKKETKEQIKHNLIEGVKQGLYRAEIDIEILSMFRAETVDLGFNPRIFKKEGFDILKYQMETVDNFLRGILTLKGLEIYEFNKNKFL